DHDPTGAVGIYLESFGNPRKFSRIARRLALTKPVVVATGDLTGHRLPPGHQVRTSRAPHGAVDAMLDNSGVIKVGNHDSLMDVLQVLATQPLPAGSSVGILSNSASMGRLLADAAESHGLSATKIIGGLDLEGTRSAAEKHLRAQLAQLFDDERIDAVAVCLQPTVSGHQHNFFRTISQAGSESGKPLVMSLIGTLDTDVALNHIGDAGPVLEASAL